MMDDEEFHRIPADHLFQEDDGMPVDDMAPGDDLNRAYRSNNRRLSIRPEFGDPIPPMNLPPKRGQGVLVHPDDREAPQRMLVHPSEQDAEYGRQGALPTTPSFRRSQQQQQQQQQPRGRMSAADALNLI